MRPPQIRSFIARLAVVCLASATGSCVIRSGPSAERLESTPRGVTATLETGGATIIAEVLGVNTDGLTILAGDRIARIAWSSIDAGEVVGMPGSWTPPTPPDPEGRDWLRQSSRFPLGISEDVLSEVLEFHGQNEPDRIGASP